MTIDEALEVLAILKAAYPNSYKGMSKEEAKGTAMVWATQFAETPYELVLIAVNKLVSTNTFPPSISEVKARIKSLYWEASSALNLHRQMKHLNEATVAKLKRIIEYTEPMQIVERCEPSLCGLLTEYSQKYLGEGG